MSNFNPLKMTFQELYAMFPKGCSLILKGDYMLTLREFPHDPITRPGGFWFIGVEYKGQILKSINEQNDHLLTD